MTDLSPLLSEERADDPEGLWATKQYGDFKESDHLQVADYVTGSVEVRQLRSVFKLSFLDIELVNRFKPTRLSVVDADATESNESSRNAQRTDEKETAAVRLYVYLTKKKAKMRMSDLEETATLLRLDVGQEGCICLGKSFGNFDQGLPRVPDPIVYKGIVIAKRKEDAPATEEPIIYAYARIVKRRRPVVATEVLLGLAEDKDRVTRYTKTVPTLKTDKDLERGARKYKRAAVKAWETLHIPVDQEIGFGAFKRVFEELNLVIAESRALRLFKICALNGSGTIGISELEVALMIYDVVPTTPYLTPLDLFNMFDLDGGGELSWLEFKYQLFGAGYPTLDRRQEAAEVIGGAKITEPKLPKLFDKVDSNKSGAIKYTEFKQVWLEIVDLELEVKRRGIKPAFGPMARFRNKRLLLKAVEEDDRITEDKFQARFERRGGKTTARTRVDNVRKRVSLLRDEKKKRKTAEAAKSSLADASEDARKRRQKRLFLQREQAAKSCKRLELKIKQNGLQQQLVEKKERGTTLIKQRTTKRENDRIAARRAREEDQLWLSHMNLRQVPPEYYRDRNGRKRLVDLVALDLRDNRLTDLPDDFLSNMLSLRKLTISKNRLSSLLDEHWSNLEQLQVLDLSRNKLKELPASMGNLTKLQHLNISMNEVGNLPDEMGRMRDLRALRAHSNDLKTLPTSVGELVSLELCDLSCNRLEILPNGLSYATSLTRLDVSSNRLRELPLDFGNLFNLQVLNVSCNQLANLPGSVSTLKSLQVLKVGENSVVEVADAWGGMTNLVDVEASANRIVRISSGIGILTQLQKLDLYRNSIEELPPEIGLLTKLHDINLRSNLLARLPDEIGSLVRLNRLSLAHNRLEQCLTDHLGLLTGLTELDLSRNEIKALPPSFGALQDLEILNLSKNFMGALPQNFPFLTSLTDLDLSCNRFKELPVVLYGMTTLRRLDLTSNVICRLPKEVALLTSLTRLHLRHNLLKSLPLEIVDLEKHVLDLNLDPNPLTVLPDKWHTHFGQKGESSRPAGYTSGEVFEWVRAQRSFHETACEAWDEKAGLYLTGRASAKEFVDEVRMRVGEDAWRPYLEPHVLRLFFKAKRNGLPDAYHQVSQTEESERKHITAALTAERLNRVRLCESDAHMRNDQENSETQAATLTVDLVDSRRALRSEHFTQLRQSQALKEHAAEAIVS